ncbi:hypothetical protein SAMN02927900_04890 [Rhizobium mongolense subsp. loessense]|uniref:LysR substrate binding domain-containing protein n=1 Tax=Rhizobium mongolense subsp. loessense TaxID=158890 RepID=A0A1G4T995_9HYPH|nr:hypothetical protein SAMN02927900_04890 [Rhizobium mongolense subsp. loessense]
MLSHILACPDIEAGRLANVIPQFPPARPAINVVYPSRRNMSLRVRTVLDFLTQAIKEDPLMAPDPPRDRRRQLRLDLGPA